MTYREIMERIMKKAKKVKRAKKKAKKVQTYYGYMVFNDRGRFELVTGYYFYQEHAANAATEYLKTHPTWTAKVVEHRVLQTLSFDLTPVVG